MKKVFFIVCIIFLCGFSCAAQTINQNEFDKVIDYVNCRYAKAYIEKTGQGDDLAAYNNKIKSKLENCSFDNHLSHDELYKILKNNSWGQTADKLIKARIENKKFVDVSSSKTDSEIIDYIIEVSSNFKTHIGDKTIKDVETELKERYANKPQETPKVVEKAIEPTPSQAVQVTKESENKRECFWVMWMIIILEGVLLCVFSYFLYRLWRRCKKLKKMVIERENSDKSSYIKMFEKLQQLDRKFGELQERVRNIKFEPNSQNTTKIEEKNIEAINVQEPKISNVKYFRTKQGKMLQDEISNESNASFKIFNINNDEAKFEYCGGVVNPDFFTEICIFENNPADVPHKKGIKNTVSGTVKRENNNWIIDKPAKIKFI